MTAAAVPTTQHRQATRGVALFDDVPMFRHGVEALLHKAHGLHWCGQATTLGSVITLCRAERPGILVVGSELDAHGNLSRALLSRRLATTVVFLLEEGPHTASQAAYAISCGAHGVLSRSSDARTFTDGLLTAHLERRFIDPAVLSSTTRRKPFTNARLSGRELDVLKLLAEGLGNAAIGLHLEISLETARTHVRRVMRKLGAHNRSHAVAQAVRLGVLDAGGHKQKGSRSSRP